MKRRLSTLVCYIMVFTLALMGCAPAATSAPAQPTAAAIQSAATAVPPAPTQASAAQPSVVNFVTDSDTNISDWMSNVIAPAFHAKYPQYTLKVTIVRGIGNGDQDIADRAYAALQANADPQVDILEFNALSKPDLMTGGLWLKLDTTNVPNAVNVLKGLQTSDSSMPYRGSQVLLAYDSTKIPDSEVPHTFPDLITWVKAHPGQFVYCRPDKGGSGGNFVVRAIYQVTGNDPSIFKPGTPDPALTAKFADAWTLLRSINSDIYDNGAYPAGNTQSLTLLSNGSVSMSTAWSDQALQALADGVLAPTIKLNSINRPAVPRRLYISLYPQEQPQPAGCAGLPQFLVELRWPGIRCQGCRRLPGGGLEHTPGGPAIAVHQRDC